MSGRENPPSDIARSDLTGPSEAGEAVVNEIRERVEQDEYEIDADAVARALVERLLAGRTIAPDRKVSRW